MKKKAYMVNMTYEVTSDEKEVAKKIVLYLNQTNKKLEIATEYLNLLKTPFKDNTESNPDELFKTRAALRRFRDEALKNYKDFKRSAFMCIQQMSTFSNDTQTNKLSKSFVNAVEDLDLLYDQLYKLFDDIKSKDFTKNIVKKLESIQNQSEELSKMIQDRIKNHVQSNIIGNNWTDSIGYELSQKIEKRKPILLDLLNSGNK